MMIDESCIWEIVFKGDIDVVIESNFLLHESPIAHQEE